MQITTVDNATTATIHAHATGCAAIARSVTELTRPATVDPHVAHFQSTDEAAAYHFGDAASDDHERETADWLAEIMATWNAHVMIYPCAR